MDLIFITGNEGKLKEAREILGNHFQVANNGIDIEEIQEIDGTKVVIKKAQDAFNIIRQPLIVEDTSLYIVSWRGLPGALIRWFLKTVDNEGILEMLKGVKNRKAIAQTAIAYHDGKNIRIFESTINGSISDKAVGTNGFGWDKIFIPDGSAKTQAEMTSEEKNKISSRKKAFEKLRDYLLKVQNE